MPLSIFATDDGIRWRAAGAIFAALIQRIASVGRSRLASWRPASVNWN